MEANVSNSKQKRLDRQKKNAQKKTGQNVGRIIGCIIAIAVLAVVVLGVVTLVNKLQDTVTPSSDYSACIDDNGYIKGVKASDYVDVADYSSIEIPLSEVEYSDEDVEKDIQAALDSHQMVDDDASIEIKNGDKVRIDYVGTIDGVEFEGGNSNGNGSDLTIGSGQFIPGFEDQLVGHNPGEEVIVSVTFPENYGQTDLAGKPAEFAVTIHGVYTNHDFDDDFVCAYYSEFADTAEGYKKYLKDTNLEDNITAYIKDYLKNNTVVKSYPKKYLRNIKATTMYSDEQGYKYMNQMYEQYYGQAIGSFEDYTGKTQEQYLVDLDAECKDVIKYNLACQAIAEAVGFVPTEEDLKANIMGENGDEALYNETIETYGKGYRMLAVIEEKAVEVARKNVVLK